MLKVILKNCLTNDINGTYNLNVGLYNYFLSLIEIETYTE